MPGKVAVEAKTKNCKKCGQTKSITEFHKNAKSADGLERICKLCKRQEIRDYRARSQGRAPIQSKPVKPVKAPPPPPSAIALEPCKHHWLCGDEIISQVLPGFFQNRLYTPVNIELQVCRNCLLEKRVQLWPHDQAIEDVVAAPRPPQMQELIIEKETPMTASTNGHSATMDLDDGPVVNEETLEVKYKDALEVIRHQQTVIDEVTVRLEVTTRLLGETMKRFRLAEIETEILKLEQERAQLLDQVA